MNIQKSSNHMPSFNNPNPEEKTDGAETRKGSETQTAKGEPGRSPFGNPSGVYVNSKASSNVVHKSESPGPQDESKNNSSREEWIKMFGNSNVKFGLERQSNTLSPSG